MSLGNYSLNMAAVFGNISRFDVTIEAHHRTQPNKTKLALHKPLLSL